MQKNKQALAAFAKKKAVKKNQPTVAIEPTELKIVGMRPSPQNTEVDQSLSLEFTPFSQSPLWQMQRNYFIEQGPKAWQNNQVPHYITNTPSMVNAYANLVIHYLLDGLHNGSIDAEQPIELLELGAGSGRFAMQMLRCLSQLVGKYGLGTLDFCYLISDISEKNRSFISEHPYLQGFIKAGRAKVINYDVLADDSSELAGKNPLIVVANYLFDSLPQELLYLHYGELYQGELGFVLSQSQPQDAPFKDIELYYRWQKQTDLATFVATLPAQLQDFYHQLLEYYISHLNALPLLLPTGALNCLQQLQQSSQKGMLLLSADIGQVDIKAIAKQSLPELNEHGSFSLPVNFDCINQYLAGLDGLGHSVQHRNNGFMFNLVIVPALGSEQNRFIMTQQAWELWIENYNPDDFFQIKRSLHGATEVLTEKQIFSYLRLSHYDPKVLQLFLPKLLEQGVAIAARMDWNEILDKVWRNYIPIGEGGEQGEFAFKLALLAIDLSHWALAQECLFSCLKFHGDSLAVFHNMALVAHATGDNELATQCCKLALKLSPEDKQAKGLADEIDAVTQSYQQLPWFELSVAKQELIALQPLALHHVDEFYLQYLDINIAAMSRSYYLDTPERVKQAIQTWQQDNTRANYAVIHQHLGLVGVTSLEFHFNQSTAEQKQASEQEPKQSTSANFSFWIGIDYQNCGFGQIAANLCIEQAKAIAPQYGMTFLTTSVFLHNHASKHVLEKAGFIELGIEKGEFPQREWFMYLPLVADDGNVKAMALSQVGEVLP